MPAHPRPVDSVGAVTPSAHAPPLVTVGEVLTLGAAGAVAVVATVSLATAHLRVLSLGSVLVGAVVVSAALGAAVVRSRPRARLVWDVPGLVVLAGVGLVAAVFFLPGYHYAAGDRDPGGYVMHGIAMARYGSYDIPDELLASDLPVELAAPNARFLGVWIGDAETGQIVPQFYHLWPALLATAWNLRGWGGVADTTPVVGVLAVLVTVALVRRIASTPGRAGAALGLIAAAVTGLLLSTSMLEVWQAKYPSAEIIAQLLFVAACLGVAISVQSGLRWPAGAAGLLVGVGYLGRADGLLLVLVAVGVGATLWVLRRFDPRGAWFGLGLGLVLPYALWQAYGPAREYTLATTGLGVTTVAGGIGGVLVAALVLRPILGPLARWVERRVTDRTTQRVAGAALAVLLLALFGLGVARPHLFPEDLLTYNGRVVRSYDEVSLYRLAWFFTWPGLVLMLGGAAYIVLRRWRAVEWVVLVPLVLFFPLYAWHALNSTWLMWWGRRFVPTVVIGVLVLTALALAWLSTRWLASSGRRIGRLALAVVGAASAVGLLAVSAGQSWSLRTHDEWGGSYEIGRRIAAVAGDQRGIFLWSHATYCCAAPTTLLAGPLWLIHDQISVLMPADPALVPRYVAAYAEHFADEPVFLVLEAGIAVPDVPGCTVSKVLHIVGDLPRWEESSTERPDEGILLRHDVTVYRVRAAS